MTIHPSSLTTAARRLTEALDQETRLARAGALADLVAAASAKHAAFSVFQSICETFDPVPVEPPGIGPAIAAEEAGAIRRLIAAAHENALVLEAVNAMLDDVATRLRTLVGGMADPGVYAPGGRAVRHVPAARIDARA
jgi:hypothetical protein